jgi:hypothetical protein
MRPKCEHACERTLSSAIASISFMLNGKRILVVTAGVQRRENTNRPTRESKTSWTIILVDDGSHGATKVAAELGLTTFMHRQTTLGYGRNQRLVIAKLRRSADIVMRIRTISIRQT